MMSSTEFIWSSTEEDILSTTDMPSDIIQIHDGPGPVLGAEIEPISIPKPDTSAEFMWSSTEDMWSSTEEDMFSTTDMPSDIIQIHDGPGHVLGAAIEPITIPQLGTGAAIKEVSGAFQQALLITFVGGAVLFSVWLLTYACLRDNNCIKSSDLSGDKVVEIFNATVADQSDDETSSEESDNNEDADL